MGRVTLSPIRAFVVLSLFAPLLLTVTAGCAPREAPPADVQEQPPVVQPAPEEPAVPENGQAADEPTESRALVENKCAGCHGLAQVWDAEYDPAEWAAVVARMEANGLRLTDAERAAILEYLAAAR